MTARNVFRAPLTFTQSSVLNACAEALHQVQGTDTDRDTADLLGWSDGTVCNVRNRNNGLTLWKAMTAARVTRGAFLQPLLALIGLRCVPLDAACTSDEHCQTRLMQLGVKIAMARDPSSPGGTEMTPSEARGMIGELDEFQAHMDRIRSVALMDVAA